MYLDMRHLLRAFILNVTISMCSEAYTLEQRCRYQQLAAYTNVRLAQAGVQLEARSFAS
jgi:hypothetical protein